MTHQNDKSNHQRALDPNRRNKTVEERIQEVENQLQILEKSINSTTAAQFCPELDKLWNLNKELINSNPGLYNEFSRLKKKHCPQS